MSPKAAEHVTVQGLDGAVSGPWPPEQFDPTGESVEWETATDCPEGCATEDPLERCPHDFETGYATRVRIANGELN